MTKFVEISIKVTQNVSEIKMGKNKQKNGKISPKKFKFELKQVPEKEQKRKKRNQEEEDIGIMK